MMWASASWITRPGTALYGRGAARSSTVVTTQVSRRQASFDTPMPSYQVTASNPATESENRIHADEVARRYGFAGGLVPGVTVYAYACAPIVEAHGADWVERGSARLRFIAP